MMERYQRTVIYLITLIILTIGTGGTLYPFPVPAGRTSPVYRVAHNETGQPAKRPDGGYPEPAFPSMQRDVHRSQWTGKWISASPPQLGFKQEALMATVEQIGRIKGIYSLIIVRNGYLAIERYFREGYRSKPHNLKSASKSVLSALIGIAIDEGYLGLDQPISEILPQGKILNDPRKAAITVRHLLTMTSGLSPTSYQAYNAWVLNGDWVKTALDRPLIAEPGTHFHYSTGNSHLLSAVLTATTGISTKAFALEKLFNPMSITVYGWETDPKGIYQGGNNLSLIPLDMAKIGLLYLNGGKYGDRQLVPKQWVDVSIRAYYQGENVLYGSYGYLWFSQPGGEDAFVAVGYGGQYIYVSTTYDCVIVITATLESKGRSWERQLFALIQNGILGNIQTD